MALRNPEPWLWVVAGLVVLALIVLPALVILIGSGVVGMDHEPRMGAAGLVIIGLVIVAGLGILAALLWPPTHTSQTPRRKTA